MNLIAPVSIVRSPWLRRGIKRRVVACAIPRQSRGLFGLVLAVASVQSLWAQDDDTLLRAAAQRSVAVATILDAPLNTPEQRLQAVFSMLDLGENDVAAALLTPMLATEYDDETRAALVAKFGTARFLRLARLDKPVSEEDPGPLAGAQKFAMACLEAAQEESRQPERIAELVEQLNAAKPADRNAAQVDLAVAGTAAGKACLEALAQETEPERRANIMRAIVRLRPAVDPQLMAVLAAGEGLLLRDVAEIAGHTGMINAAPLLAAIAVRSDTTDEARSAAQKALVDLKLSPADLISTRELLLGEIRRLEAAPPVASEAAGNGYQWWDFDTNSSQFSSLQLPERLASLARIHRLAQTLTKLPTATDADRQLALLYAVQLSKRLGQPLSPAAKQLAEQLDAGNLSLALSDALQHEQAAAAIACTELLGQRGDVSVLHSTDGRPSPLAKALQHPNRDVRFAALEAIMQLKPRHSFAGASYVPKALWEFVAAGDVPQAVAASSVTDKASDWAGQLRGLGYDAFGAIGGRQALQAALDSPRLTLMIVDSDIGQPRLREVLYQFRRGRTTAQVPVAIFCSSPNLADAMELADQDPLLVAIARPHREGDFAAIVEQLNRINPAQIDAKTRQVQSTKALGWVAELEEQGHPYSEFYRGSEVVGSLVYDPELKTAVIKALASMATAAAQETLVDFASNPTATIENRRAAAAALATSIDSFGIMLTPTQVRQQYDRYNASETADRETQQVLGQVLDVLERKPNAASP